MPMLQSPSKRYHKALIIGPQALEKSLSIALNEHGYFVDHCRTRPEGTRKFRAHKQAIIILDVSTFKRLSARLFRFFHLVRESTIILIAVSEKEQALATKCLIWGAHDIVTLPLNPEALNVTLSRTFEYQKAAIRKVFVKNAFFFSLLMMPVWITLMLVLLH